MRVDVGGEYPERVPGVIREGNRWSVEITTLDELLAIARAVEDLTIRYDFNGEALDGPYLLVLERYPNG
jgi:hypothetical protein